jgi:nucleoside-diphosphate-sugar epimerase
MHGRGPDLRPFHLLSHGVAAFAGGHGEQGKQFEHPEDQRSYPMPRTIAITGATGFAGRPAVAALLARGHQVKALVRDAEKAGLPAQVELVEGDLNATDALRKLAEGADAFLHLAGAIAALNRAGFFAGVSLFVHVSSLAAREPSLSPYGASKAAAEEVVKTSGLASVILRPAAVYGPGDRATLPLIRELTRPVAMIPSTADARFSLLHVGDLARMLAAACEMPREGIFEVSDSKSGGYSWGELCAVAAEHEGRNVRPVFLPRGLTNLAGRASEALARLRSRPAMVNLGKIAELYHPDWVTKGEGWPLENLTAFPAGLAETLAWYRQQGWLPPARGAGRSTPQNNSETRK